MVQHRLSIADIAAPQLADSGDFIYRITQPGAALGSIPGIRVVSFTNICGERYRIFREADALIIHMIGDPDLLPVISDRRKRGKLTIFEVSDNFMDFQKNNPASSFYEDPKNRAAIMQLLSMCDAMQTTMPELEKRFASLNPKCAVFMNQMSNLGTPGREKGRGVTVGWGGSAGHYQDMKAAAPALIGWALRRSDATLAIMADDEIVSLFAELPDDKIRIVKPGSLNKYYDFTQSLDIGIAPARNEEFNICRSDVKFMEYASRGVVPVCSNTPAYSKTLRNGDTGFLFDTVEEMIAILDRLADDAALRERVGHAAYEYVRTERSESACAAQRLGFYEKLAEELNVKKDGTLEWLDSFPRAKRTGKTSHFHIEFDMLESHLYNGLVLQFRNSDPDSAKKMFEKAARLAPDSAQAHYFLGNSLPAKDSRKAARAYEETLRIRPESCSAATALASLRAARGDSEGAINILKKIQKLVPEFAPGWAMEGEILRDSGIENEALPLFLKALEANPHYAPAATMAGATYLSLGDFDKAAEMFKRALLVTPGSLAANLGLGAALTGSGKHDEAAQFLEASLRLAPDNNNAAMFFLDICKNDYKLGAMERAIKRLELLFELRPADAEAAFWLARAYERAGSSDKAASLWKIVADIDATGRFSAIARGKIEKA